MRNKKVALLILDGWGLGRQDETDGIHLAKTPFFDTLYSNFPHAKLITHGEDVGLPEGQMGNSEVGHMNIGAGRVVYQDLVRINKSIREGSFFNEKVLLDAVQLAKANTSKIHLLGLVSDGGVHSTIGHLFALIDFFTHHNFPKDKVLIHAITDGRDCDPKSGIRHMQTMQDYLEDKSATLATVIGRYYAMDRDKRWERIKIAYDLLVHGIGKEEVDGLSALEHSYGEGVTDEFVKPVKIKGVQGTVEPNDVMICFNFRTDRCREITEVLTQREMHEYTMHTLPLHYITMTNYDKTFNNVHVIFDKDELSNTLGEVLSRAGKTQLRIAETEKYPHVSFFFSGGREMPFTGEKRIMIPSPNVATYDLQPEMSAHGIKEAVIHEMRTTAPDFICLNYANGDMVGHTGVPEAIIQACETVDACLKETVEVARECGYSVVIIADHGNADLMVNADGTPNTAHTTNLVPCIVLDNEVKQLNNGRLSDVAPTVLALMGIAQPNEMGGIKLITAH
jgi:2,3-bisphosphoglycerate-independent phosphoglycerate mutase